METDDLAENLLLAKDLQSAYEASILVILSRLMQSTHFRPFAADFLCRLSSVPVSCTTLLSILQVTGTKALLNSSVQQRGMRQDALSVRGALVFGRDEVTGWQCLQQLLWETLSDDFKLRSRAVDLLVAEVIHHTAEVDDQVLSFALHSLVYLLGVETIRHGGLVADAPQTRGSETAAATGETVGSTHQPPASSRTNKFSLTQAVLSYDQGRRYDGDFADYFQPGKHQENFVKAVHLLEKLCPLESTMLIVLVELGCLGIDLNLVETAEGTNNESWNIQTLVKSKLKVIIGELTARVIPVSATKIFGIVSGCHHPQAATILLFVLQLLVPSVDEPPRYELVVLVLQYLQLPLPAEFTEENVALISQLDDAAFLLLSPLLGGLPTLVVKHCLPRLVKMLGGAGAESLDALKNVFARITHATPPPLTRAQLLVSLLRIDLDAHGIDKKAFIDFITVCSTNKGEYTAKVVRDALEELVQDETPPFALMRIAILSAQSFLDVKAYVLAEVIPAMVRKQVWSTAPKVWEGVLYGARLLAVNEPKGAEATLRALLTVPFQQLRGALSITTNLVPSYSKLLKSASVEEREQLLLGVSGTVEKEKEKVFRDLIEGKVK